MVQGTAVNRPTDPKVKEQDINNKLQLYGIFTAFAAGKVPSNKQIDVALNSFLQSKALSSPSDKLSDEGKKLVADTRDVVEKAKILLLSKNEGNLLQEFIWAAQHISGGDQGLPGAPTDKDTAKEHGNQALQGLRTLGTLIISNGQFRKLLSDAGVLLRDIAGDAAQKAASKVNPSEEQLQQIDAPAPDNQWHDVPDLSASNIKSQVQSAYNKNVGLSKDDAKAALNDAATHADKTQDGQAAAQTGVDSALSKSNISEEDKQKAKDKANQLKESADATRERTLNYFKGKVPQERREQTIWRLKKMLVEIQGHEDYSNAIDTLLSLAETYTGYAKVVGQDTVGAVQGVHEKDPALVKVEKQLRTLLERFANSTSFDDLFEAFNVIYKDAERDPELKNWFKSLDGFIRRSLKEPGYVITDEADTEANNLYDQGNFLLRQRYSSHTDRVLDEFKFLAEQFEQDPQNKAFADATQKLFLDLGNDHNGKPTFKPHLVKDLTEVIIPAVFENVRYVPIPRIEYSDPTIDAIVENLVVESDNLFPNAVEIRSDNYFKWGRKTVVSKNKNKIMIAASGVQMDLRDVSYYIKKKQGFPSITDKGVMDVFMGGEGFSFKLALETADPSDRHHYFKVDKVEVNIKNLKLKMKQSNHKLLFNIFKPLLLGVVKPALTKVIEKQIRDTIQQGDAYFYEISKEADRALEEAQNDPENIPNIYSRYVDAIRDRAARGQKKVEEAAKNTTTNVAITQQDSIFKNIKLPGGISTKATDFKEQALKGPGWESPVFSLGSASESSNIPFPAPITRKPHKTATASLAPAPATNQVSTTTVNSAKHIDDGPVTNGNGYNSNPIFN